MNNYENLTPEQMHFRATRDKGLDKTACSACGHVPRRTVDYGDFTEYEVRCLVAEYCTSVTLGNTGWGVPFKVWIELHGIARHDKMHRLIRLPNVIEHQVR